MEIKAKLKFARTGVLKAREVARLIYGKNINTALKYFVCESKEIRGFNRETFKIGGLYGRAKKSDRY